MTVRKTQRSGALTGRPHKDPVKSNLTGAPTPSNRAIIREHPTKLPLSSTPPGTVSDSWNSCHVSVPTLPRVQIQESLVGNNQNWACELGQEPVCHDVLRKGNERYCAGRIELGMRDEVYCQHFAGEAEGAQCEAWATPQRSLWGWLICD